MLVYDFIQIDRPFAAVRDLLLGPPMGWLVDDATAAYVDGEHLSLRVGPAGGAPMLSKRVHLDLGSRNVRDDAVVLSIRWWAAGAKRLFPVMEADLEATPMGEGITAITFMGHYDPPLRAVGRATDRMLFHRLAESTVRALLVRVAGRLAGQPQLGRTTPQLGGLEPAAG